MKNIVLSFCILISSFGLKAQSEQLIIKSSNKGHYVEHQVTAKENFYSLGRAYNVHPKHIALFNSLDMSKGLGLGQTIKIPLTDTNFNQKAEAGMPVYYVTGNSESLYKVSTNNNNVLLEKLRKWNHLSNDKITPGKKLIVGYLVNTQTQALSVNNEQKTEPVNKTDTDTNKDVAKTVVKKEEIKQPKDEPKKDDRKQKEEPKKEDVLPNKNNEVVQVKEESKAVGSNQGYFKTSFDQQVKQQPLAKEETVTSGIFKTSSGWADGKYYLLMNGAQPGTILKITNPLNNKTIFAKLLGEMGDLKENHGLNIRISDAAAAALDISDNDKFIVKLNY